MTLRLSLHTGPEVPLEAERITPDAMDGMTAAQIATLPLLHGNRQVPLADFFRVEGAFDGTVHLEGDLSRVKLLGAGMSRGTVHVHGNAGAHLGAGMTGGNIVVEGDAGDWVAPEMAGGRIHIHGNAGHLVGSAYRGSAAGMSGGEILINGSVRNEAGHGMRNGLIAIGGDSGDFTGVNMLAGTIVVLGRLGIRSGAGMKRGSIASMHEAELLPTFSFACRYRPLFLSLYLAHLRRAGLPIEDSHLAGLYSRWSGDAVELNRGEILLFLK